MEKVSIVVPIYNAEKYLDECINSIINQTYKNIEIILINDGSTDNSEKICLKYSKKDERIKYYYQKNAGVSSARNNGIDKSTGTYISFIDSDDYVEEKYIQTLVDEINGVDLSVCNLFDDTKVLKYQTEKMEKLKFLKKLFDHGQKKFIYYGYVWSKLYKLDIIKKEKIKFTDNIYFNEDRLFLYEYLISNSVSKVKICDKPLYHYRNNVGGAMNNRKNVTKLKTEFDAFRIMKKKSIDEIITQYIDYEVFKNHCIYYRLTKDKYFINNVNKKKLLKIIKYKKIKLIEKLKIIYIYMKT